MPPAPSEPEKYSIDEMMERLKASPSEDPAVVGERVIRADGTEAIRVRKRKRRTDQPKREEAKRFRRIRIIQVTVALVLLLLTGLVIVGAYVYANTVPYRKSITQAIARSAGASVEFTGFRVNPATANAEAIDFEWPAGNVLKSIQLLGVSAKISPLSLFGTSLRGDEISAREGNIFLHAPAPDQPLCTPSDPSGSIPVRFSRIFVPRINITVGDPTQPAFKIVSSEASLRLDKASSQTVLHLYRGNLQFTGWPSFKIDRAILEFHGTETEVIGLRLIDSQPKHGALELAGTIRPFATDSPSTLSVKLDSFDLGELLGLDFADLINAKIDTHPVTRSNYLTFVPGSRTSANLDIAFKNTILSKVSIRGFPFLLSLVRTLDDKWYENPSFIDDVYGIVHRSDSGIEIRELKLESKSRMAIKATITATPDKALSGTMEIGIPDSVAELSLNARIDSMLSPPHDGFRWLTLKLGGTLTHPSDDFAALYAAAKDSSTEQSTPPDTSDEAGRPGVDPGKAFDKITRPGGP
ncbi:MAG: hypothetical protein NTW21_09755 [Verrucomicrobia bacterium]|nr:hypothetical protein [Verrucomicrobiota bacterium]